MALRPLRQPWQKAGFKTQSAYRSSPQFRRLQPPKPPRPFRATQGQQAPAGGWTDWNRQTGRTTEADYNWRPNPGEGVQDFINSGRINWDTGLGKLGYTDPSQGMGTGGQPDYGSIIAGDWEVQQAESDMAAQMARARGNFQGGLRQALISAGLGGDLSKLGNLGRYIDADTIKAAAANKYSATAQNQQAATRNRDTGNASLAARGILSSGGTTKMQTDVTSAQQAADYGVLQNFLSGGAEGLMGLGDLESSLANQLAMARGNAGQRAADQYQMGQEGGPEGGASPAAAAAARRRMLTRRQFAAKPVRPQARGRTAQQRYANYVRAYRRQNK